MSSKTTNLNLHKIDLTDAPPDITVLNENWDTIDTEFSKVIKASNVGNSVFGDNLNNWVEPGFYATTSTTTNYPSKAYTAYATVIVFGTVDNANRITQLYIPWVNQNAGKIFSRQLNDTTWSDWSELAQAGYGYNLFDTPISENANLNSYLTPGVYGVTNNTIAETITNIPEQIAGLLIVRCATGDSKVTGAYVYLTQLYIPYSNPVPYVRQVYTGETENQWSYGSWIKTASYDSNGLLSSDTLPIVPITKGGTGATTVAGARNALGLGNTSGALPIANGGTGATSAANALNNLGIVYSATQPTGTTGMIWLKPIS